MPRPTRRSTRNRQAINESSDEDDREVAPTELKRRKKTKPVLKKIESPQQITKNDSSSESDIETYLQPINKIDLSSSFFNVDKKPQSTSFDAIENHIFAGINRLSGSDSEPELDHSKQSASSAEQSINNSLNKINFQQLQDYTNKLEEAKKVVDKYEARKRARIRKSKQRKEPQETSISDLLAKGEAKVDSLQDTLHSSDYESFSDSEKDWEEVEAREVKEKSEAVIPKEGVQITVELPGVMRKKKGLDLIASMKRRLNRIKKENQVYVHKVHLLCWIAHGNYINKVLNNEHLLALAMSLLPSQHCYPPERTDLSYLEAIVKWFSNAIPVNNKILSKNLQLDKALRLQINRKVAYNKKMLVYIFICMLRALGIQCRLVLSFVVLPLRPPPEELHSLSTKVNTEKSIPQKSKKESNKTSTPPASLSIECNQEKSSPEKSNKKSNKMLTSQTSLSKVESVQKSYKATNNKDVTKTKGQINKKAEESSKTAVDKKKESQSKNKSENKTRNSSTSKKQTTNNAYENNKPNLKILSSVETSSKSANTRTSKKVVKLKSSKVDIPQVDGANDSDSEPTKTSKKQKPNLKKLSQRETNSCPIKNHPKRLKRIPNYADRDSGDDFKSKMNTKNVPQAKVNLQKLKSPQSTTNTLPKNNVQNDIIAIMKGRMSEERSLLKTKLVKSKSKNVDYDSDYAPDPVKKQNYDSDDDFREKTKVKRRVQVKPPDNKDESKKKSGHNVWVEVYLENEEKWISVDVTKGEIHCVKQLYKRASHPITYILAWNNNNSVKDITQRYCPNWNTVTRKLRIDKTWWEASLKPFVGIKVARDKEEDEELARLQLDQPLPKTISEYKDHPLYVLKRHLLKFQALYPSDCVSLGFIREEPVYSRDCVHTLHSRETWLKHAKVVKLGEKPYKIVKARPKYDKLSGQVITDQPLEVFGLWQVEDYVPPTAKDGVVPRNAYGNVELFKACMLPKGTVHLQLPGLNKVARKMNIDCVPAVVGFDIHSGWTHPTFDGFVVCEEFSESLIAAWYLEQEEREKREEEKTEKRVYDNWKRLIKGLLIRERLKARYDYGAPSQDDAKNKKRKSKGPKLVSKKRRICSGSESD